MSTPKPTQVRPGLFVTFEGIEGVGKSTQVDHLLQTLQQQGFTCLKTREPGGTPIGESIRQVFLKNEDGHINPVTEFLLISAARSQHVNEIILPALNQGMVVLCDRFCDASIAYQGFGRGLSRGWISATNQYVTGSLDPDITFLFDLPVPIALDRLKTREVDRIEKSSADFHERVRQGYLSLARENQDRIVVLDATWPINRLKQHIATILLPHLARMQHA